MSKKNKEQRNKQKIEDEVLFLDEGYWLDEDDEKFGRRGTGRNIRR